jgi:SAM-dependent methyltransferase
MEATPRGCGHPALYGRVATLVAGRGASQHVLDIPAGNGVLSARLLAAGHRVVAADLVPEGFGVPGVECVPADMSQPLPFEAGRFDVVACLEGIEHLRHPYAFVEECRRILRPGGCLILSTPNVLKLTSRVKFLLGGFLNAFGRPLNEHRVRHGLYGHIALMSYYEARFMLHCLGFRILAVTTSRGTASDWLCTPLVPGIALFTWHALRREQDPEQRASNAEILHHVLSADLLFGKHLVLVAERRG